MQFSPADVRGIVKTTFVVYFGVHSCFFYVSCRGRTVPRAAWPSPAGPPSAEAALLSRKTFDFLRKPQNLFFTLTVDSQSSWKFAVFTRLCSSRALRPEWMFLPRTHTLHNTRTTRVFHFMEKRPFFPPFTRICFIDTFMQQGKKRNPHFGLKNKTQDLRIYDASNPAGAAVYDSGIAVGKNVTVICCF